MGGQRQGGGGISVSLSLGHSYLTCSSCSQATPRVLLARTTNERSMPPPPTSDAATNPRTKIPKHFPPTRNKLLYYRKKKTALGPVAGGFTAPAQRQAPLLHSPVGGCPFRRSMAEFPICPKIKTSGHRCHHFPHKTETKDRRIENQTTQTKK